MRKLKRKSKPYNPSAMPVPNRTRLVRRAINRRREIDHGATWYCVRTRIGQERRAELGIRAAGFDAYRPVDECWRVYERRCSDVSTGWFGPYLFVGALVDDGHGFPFGLLRNVDGMHSVLGASGKPLAVPPEVLQAVSDQIAGHQEPAPVAFSEGQRVSVQTGPFAELCGIVQEAGRDAARVLVEMFGKQHAVELDFVALKAA